MVYFEDLAVGETARFGAYPMTREEVIEFATRFDPQGFHIDDAIAAANPVFGRISASAMHTLSVTGRLITDEWKRTGFSPIAGLGMDEMRVTNPVFPGDTLSVGTEVLSLRRSASRPDSGIVHTLIQTFNQDGRQVMRYIAVLLLRVREPVAQAS